MQYTPGDGRRGPASGALEAIQTLNWETCLIKRPALTDILGGEENLSKALSAQHFIGGQFLEPGIATDLHVDPITGRAAIGIYTSDKAQAARVVQTLAGIASYDPAFKRYIGPEITLDIVIFVGKRYPK